MAADKASPKESVISSYFHSTSTPCVCARHTRPWEGRDGPAARSPPNGKEEPVNTKIGESRSESQNERVLPAEELTAAVCMNIE